MMYIYSLEKDNASLFWAANLDSTEVENSFNNLRLLTRFLSHMPTVPSLFSVLDSPSLVLVVLGNASPILPFSALTQKGNQTTAQPIFLSLSLPLCLSLSLLYPHPHFSTRLDPRLACTLPSSSLSSVLTTTVRSVMFTAPWCESGQLGLSSSI